MSRRRQRSDAYRARKRGRNYAKGRRKPLFTTYVDPKFIEVLARTMVSPFTFEETNGHTESN